MRKKLEERFWPKVRKAGPADCWEWTAAKCINGYGQIRSDADRWPMLKAHRAAYEMLIGQIPDGLVIDHLCKNKSCVNPAHMEPVTNEENARRAMPLKDFCVNGHPYSGKNIGKNGSNLRCCRACKRATYNRWYYERGGKEYRAQHG